MSYNLKLLLFQPNPSVSNDIHSGPEKRGEKVLRKPFK